MAILAAKRLKLGRLGCRARKCYPAKGVVTVLMKILFCVVVAMVMIAPIYADEEKAQEGGFLSDVVSSVKDKMNKVASGEEPIFDENAKGMDDTLMSDGDPRGRRPYMPRTGRRAGEEQ